MQNQKVSCFLVHAVRLPLRNSTIIGKNTLIYARSVLNSQKIGISIREMNMNQIIIPWRWKKNFMSGLFEILKKLEPLTYVAEFKKMENRKANTLHRGYEATFIYQTTSTFWLLVFLGCAGFLKLLHPSFDAVTISSGSVPNFAWKSLLTTISADVLYTPNQSTLSLAWMAPFWLTIGDFVTVRFFAVPNKTFIIVVL